jgi:prepilin-type N-terminal cleavage/methylation domain-containing protein
MMRTRRPDGFTLLEMIVVMMIAGMAVALGFQSLGQWRRAEAAIANAGSATRQNLLTREWLRESLRGLVPVESPAFSGQRDGLTGMTLSPTLASQGGLTPVQWRLESNSQGTWLTLTEPGNTLRLPLPGGATARFIYLDKDGKTYEQWPPALGLNDQLPAAVGLSLDLPGQAGQVWLSSIAGVRNPLFQPYEPERD